MGSERTYDLTGVKAPTAAIPTSGLLPKAAPANAAAAMAALAGTGSKRKTVQDGVELAFNPEELEQGLDEETVRKRYEEQQSAGQEETEDFSDMVAEHATRQAKKRKVDTDKKDKKKEKFKF